MNWHILTDAEFGLIWRGRRRGRESGVVSSAGQVTMKDLAEEAKKRIVVLAICVIGLSYLMSYRAPAAVVSLVGRKEYEQCARDLYFFLQLLLLSAFPELDSVFKQLHEDKHKFGDFKS